MKKTISRFYFSLFLLLGTIIIFELVSLVNKLNLTKMFDKLSLDRGSTFSISNSRTKGGIIKIVLASSQTVIPNRDIKAKIIFNSFQEPISGLDVILSFDPNLISLVDISGNKEIFQEILVNDRTSGSLKITAYNPLKPLKGEQVLSFLTLRLLKNQTATINLKFEKEGETKDTNLISQITQNDILQEVEPLVLTPSPTR